MNGLFRPSAILCASLAACSLTACGGSSSTPISPIPVKAATPVPTPSASAVASTSVAYGATLLSGATFVKRATFGSIGVDVALKMHDLPGLLAYAKSVTDPKNALYRHWLTPAQLGDRFGVPASDYAAATKYFTANGIGVQTFPQRQVMRVLGAQANMERTLGVQFGVYKKGGQTFVAPMSAPRPNLPVRVAAIGNAVRYNLISRRYLALRAGSNFVEGYGPQQIANAFDYAGAYAAGYNGSGITIGVIGTAPISEGDPSVTYDDVAEYRKLYGITGTGTVTQVVDTANYSPGNGNPTAGTGTPGEEYTQSGLATPPPLTSPTSAGCVAQSYNPSNPSTYSSITDFTTCNPEDLEAQLDTEQAAVLAPDANVRFYIAYNPDECYAYTCNTSTFAPTQELGVGETDDEIQAAIADNQSDIVTMSFGDDETTSQQVFGDYGTGTNNFGPMEFASLVSEGVAVFASSGDSGAEACTNDGASLEDEPCVTYPATDPSVISVGGVNTPLDDSGRLTGPITAWGQQTQGVDGGVSGSGGGCSAYFSEPSYAAGITLPCSGMRVQPDVALNADINTGVAVVFDTDPSLGGRQIIPVGGTSVASPEMAAMWALVLQACKASSACSAGGSGSTPYRLGNPGTYLYKIYPNATEYADTFYDVLFGNNSTASSAGTGQDPGFTAGVGYDLVTGLGVPYAKNLITNTLANVP
jgi:subtilase family serine protease